MEGSVVESSQRGATVSRVHKHEQVYVTHPASYIRSFRPAFLCTAGSASHDLQLDVVFESNDDEVVPEESEDTTDVPVTVSRGTKPRRNDLFHVVPRTASA